MKVNWVNLLLPRVICMYGLTQWRYNQSPYSYYYDSAFFPQRVVGGLWTYKEQQTHVNNSDVSLYSRLFAEATDKIKCSF